MDSSSSNAANSELPNGRGGDSSAAVSGDACSGWLSRVADRSSNNASPPNGASSSRPAFRSGVLGRLQTLSQAQGKARQSRMISLFDDELLEERRRQAAAAQAALEEARARAAERQRALQKAEAKAAKARKARADAVINGDDFALDDDSDTAAAIAAAAAAASPTAYDPTLPAVLRHRPREKVVHPTEWDDVIGPLVDPIINGDLHQVMRDFRFGDLSHFLSRGPEERSHPLLHAIHHAKPHIVAFLIAAGCDPKPRGHLYPYSGDNIQSESGKLKDVDAETLWTNLTEVNSINGPANRINRGLKAMRPFLFPSVGGSAAEREAAARDAAIAHLRQLRSWYANPPDAASAKAQYGWGKVEYNEYRFERGPLPACSGDSPPVDYWGSSLSGGGAGAGQSAGAGRPTAPLAEGSPNPATTYGVQAYAHSGNGSSSSAGQAVVLLSDEEDDDDDIPIARKIAAKRPPSAAAALDVRPPREAGASSSSSSSAAVASSSSAAAAASAPDVAGSFTAAAAAADGVPASPPRSVCYDDYNDEYVGGAGGGDDDGYEGEGEGFYGEDEGAQDEIMAGAEGSSSSSAAAAAAAVDDSALLPPLDPATVLARLPASLPTSVRRVISSANPLVLARADQLGFLGQYEFTAYAGSSQDELTAFENEARLQLEGAAGDVNLREAYGLRLKLIKAYRGAEADAELRRKHRRKAAAPARLDFAAGNAPGSNDDAASSSSAVGASHPGTAGAVSAGVKPAGASRAPVSAPKRQLLSFLPELSQIQRQIEQAQLGLAQAVEAAAAAEAALQEKQSRKRKRKDEGDSDTEKRRAKQRKQQAGAQTSAANFDLEFDEEEGDGDDYDDVSRGSQSSSASEYADDEDEDGGDDDEAKKQRKQKAAADYDEKMRRHGGFSDDDEGEEREDEGEGEDETGDRSIRRHASKKSRSRKGGSGRAAPSARVAASGKIYSEGAPISESAQSRSSSSAAAATPSSGRKDRQPQAELPPFQVNKTLPGKHTSAHLKQKLRKAERVAEGRGSSGSDSDGGSDADSHPSMAIASGSQSDAGSSASGRSAQSGSDSGSVGVAADLDEDNNVVLIFNPPRLRRRRGEGRIKASAHHRSGEIYDSDTDTEARPQVQSSAPSSRHRFTSQAVAAAGVPRSSRKPPTARRSSSNGPSSSSAAGHRRGTSAAAAAAEPSSASRSVKIEQGLMSRLNAATSRLQKAIVPKGSSSSGSNSGYVSSHGTAGAGAGSSRKTAASSSSTAAAAPPAPLPGAATNNAVLELIRKFGIDLLPPSRYDADGNLREPPAEPSANSTSSSSAAAASSSNPASHAFSRNGVTSVPAGLSSSHTSGRATTAGQLLVQVGRAEAILAEEERIRRRMAEMKRFHALLAADISSKQKELERLDAIQRRYGLQTAQRLDELITQRVERQYAGLPGTSIHAMLSMAPHKRFSRGQMLHAAAMAVVRANAAVGAAADVTPAASPQRPGKPSPVVPGSVRPPPAQASSRPSAVVVIEDEDSEPRLAGGGDDSSAPQLQGSSSASAAPMATQRQPLQSAAGTSNTSRDVIADSDIFAAPTLAYPAPSAAHSTATAPTATKYGSVAGGFISLLNDDSGSDSDDDVSVNSRSTLAPPPLIVRVNNFPFPRPPFRPNNWPGSLSHSGRFLSPIELGSLSAAGAASPRHLTIRLQSPWQPIMPVPKPASSSASAAAPPSPGAGAGAGMGALFVEDDVSVDGASRAPLTVSDDEGTEDGEMLFWRLQMAARPLPAIRQHMSTILALQLADIQAAEARLVAAEEVQYSRPDDYSQRSVDSAAREARLSLRSMISSLSAIERFTASVVDAGASSSSSCGAAGSGDSAESEPDICVSPSELLLALLDCGLQLLTVPAPSGGRHGSAYPTIDGGIPLLPIAVTSAGGSPVQVRPRAIVTCLRLGDNYTTSGPLQAVIRSHLTVLSFLLRLCRRASQFFSSPSSAAAAPAALTCKRACEAIVRVACVQLLQLQCDYPGLLGLELRQAAETVERFDSSEDADDSAAKELDGPVLLLVVDLQLTLTALNSRTSFAGGGVGSGVLLQLLHDTLTSLPAPPSWYCSFNWALGGHELDEVTAWWKSPAAQCARLDLLHELAIALPIACRAEPASTAAAAEATFGGTSSVVYLPDPSAAQSALSLPADEAVFLCKLLSPLFSSPSALLEVDAAQKGAFSRSSSGGTTGRLGDSCDASDAVCDAALLVLSQLCNGHVVSLRMDRGIDALASQAASRSTQAASSASSAAAPDKPPEDQYAASSAFITAARLALWRLDQVVRGSLYASSPAAAAPLAREFLTTCGSLSSAISSLLTPPSTAFAGTSDPSYQEQFQSRPSGASSSSISSRRGSDKPPGRPVVALLHQLRPTDTSPIIRAYVAAQTREQQQQQQQQQQQLMTSGSGAVAASDDIMDGSKPSALFHLPDWLLAAVLEKRLSADFSKAACSLYTSWLTDSMVPPSAPTTGPLHPASSCSLEHFTLLSSAALQALTVAPLTLEHALPSAAQTVAAVNSVGAGAGAGSSATAASGWDKQFALVARDKVRVEAPKQGSAVIAHFYQPPPPPPPPPEEKTLTAAQGVGASGLSGKAQRGATYKPFQVKVVKSAKTTPEFDEYRLTLLPLTSIKDSALVCRLTSHASLQSDSTRALLGAFFTPDAAAGRMRLNKYRDFKVDVDLSDSAARALHVQLTWAVAIYNLHDPNRGNHGAVFDDAVGSLCRVLAATAFGMRARQAAVDKYNPPPSSAAAAVSSAAATAVPPQRAAAAGGAAGGAARPQAAPGFVLPDAPIQVFGGVKGTLITAAKPAASSANSNNRAAAPSGSSSSAAAAAASAPTSASSVSSTEYERALATAASHWHSSYDQHSLLEAHRLATVQDLAVVQLVADALTTLIEIDASQRAAAVADALSLSDAAERAKRLTELKVYVPLTALLSKPRPVSYSKPGPGNTQLSFTQNEKTDKLLQQTFEIVSRLQPVLSREKKQKHTAEYETFSAHVVLAHRSYLTLLERALSGPQRLQSAVMTNRIAVQRSKAEEAAVSAAAAPQSGAANTSVTASSNGGGGGNGSFFDDDDDDLMMGQDFEAVMGSYGEESAEVAAAVAAAYEFSKGGSLASSGLPPPSSLIVSVEESLLSHLRDLFEAGDLRDAGKQEIIRLLNADEEAVLSSALSPCASVPPPSLGECFENECGLRTAELRLRHIASLIRLLGRLWHLQIVAANWQQRAAFSTTTAFVARYFPPSSRATSPLLPAGAATAAPLWTAGGVFSSQALRRIAVYIWPVLLASALLPLADDPHAAPSPPDRLSITDFSDATGRALYSGCDHSVLRVLWTEYSSSHSSILASRDAIAVQLQPLRQEPATLYHAPALLHAWLAASYWKSSDGGGALRAGLTMVLDWLHVSLSSHRDAKQPSLAPANDVFRRVWGGLRFGSGTSSSAAPASSSSSASGASYVGTEAIEAALMEYQAKGGAKAQSAVRLAYSHLLSPSWLSAGAAATS